MRGTLEKWPFYMIGSVSPISGILLGYLRIKLLSGFARAICIKFLSGFAQADLSRFGLLARTYRGSLIKYRVFDNSRPLFTQS